MTEDWAQRLARAYRVAPQDVLRFSDNQSVPVELAVASAFSPDHPSSFDLPDPRRWVQAPIGLVDPEECFAVTVEDNSADRLYPRGSTLFVRRLDAIPRPLRAGRKALVRVYADNGSPRTTMEVLVGTLGRSPAGDIVVFTRASAREIPAVVVVQRRPGDALFHERLAPLAEELVNIDYEPAPEDPAEIVGLVEFATTPE